MIRPSGIFSLGLDGKRHRSHSFSTVEEATGVRDREGESFRAVMSRTKSLPRPRTADHYGIPTLNVSIPHYRLGTPRFSARGTAILRSSAYTRSSSTDDIRSSVFAPGEFSNLLPIPSDLPGHDLLSNWNPTAPQQWPPIDGNHTSPAIEADIWDALTFPPQCNSPDIVRYSPTTGRLIAATSSRIIADLTSLNFLDYELLSDFFLVYRSFIQPTDLVAFLITRLQWAIYRGGDAGKIVNVRTFVAIRHWILNYFSDDFVPNLELRKSFCAMINALTENIQHQFKTQLDGLKEIGEIKKIWRETAKLYWDSPQFEGYKSAVIPLFPGGIAGTRECDWSSPLPEPTKQTMPPQFDTSGPPEISANHPPGLIHRVHEAGRPMFETEPVPINVTSQTADVNARRVSPMSDTSIPALSCSLPPIGFHRADPTVTSHSPALPSSLPKATVTSSSRPYHTGSYRENSTHKRPRLDHRRCGSFSDALGDDRMSTSEKNAFAGSDHRMTVPYPGSLIRGTLLPPVQPFVGVIASPVATRTNHKSAFHGNNTAIINGTKIQKNTVSSPAMKRLFNSMRRALSSKFGDSSNSRNTISADSFRLTISKPIDANGSTGMPFEASQSQPLVQKESRVDWLGLLIVEAFNKALNDNTHFRNMIEGVSNSSSHKDVFQFDQEIGSKERLQGGKNPMARQLSNGSDSIVIVDDTNAMVEYVMSGALPAEDVVGSESHHTHRDAVEAARAHQASRQMDPTATDESKNIIPSPGQDFGSPLDQPVSITVGLEVEEPITNAPAIPMPIQLRRPTLPGHGHSFKSSGSVSLRRYASYQSGMARRARPPSFEASEASGSEAGFALEQSGHGRVLRRRPGGDLRAVDKVADLEHLPRPRSTGSIGTYTDSLASSALLRTSDSLAPGINSKDFALNQSQTFSLSALGQTKQKQPLSLVQAHSSQPPLRPSFELEVAKLAQLPDDEEDDGGIESALLKLEGKFEQRNSSSSLGITEQPSVGISVREREVSGSTDGTDRTDLYSSSLHQESPQPPRAIPETTNELPTPLSPQKATEKGIQPKALSAQGRGLSPSSESALYSDSEDSYSSIPILDRKTSHKSLGEKTFSQEVSLPSMPKPLFSPGLPAVKDSSHTSLVHVEETDSVREMRSSSKEASKDFAAESFLLDEDEDISDLSSDLSDDFFADDPISPISATFPQNEVPVATTPEIKIRTHPLRHPPSPPTTQDPSPNTPSVGLSRGFHKPPPTPDMSPVHQPANKPFAQSPKPSNTSTIKVAIEPRPLRIFTKPPHIPYILEYDSEVLAQQFTLIEKDLLNEIDWKELIDLRWNHSPPASRNWVDFLRTGQPKALELAAARFDIVVKWVTSEIVLTKNIDERAWALTKYIHVAEHCRRLRNYATMYQITLGICSNDCSRLKKTWELVPAADLERLKKLEEIIQPTQNFHNLRVEVESVTPEDGCIPFLGKSICLAHIFMRTNRVLGVYTHDLIFNAQKPAQIAVSPKDPPLVNFERHRTTAGIVKELIRLIGVSNNYRFEPVPGVLEKCLWMAALPDSEIRSLSRELE